MLHLPVWLGLEIELTDFFLPLFEEGLVRVFLQLFCEFRWQEYFDVLHGDVLGFGQSRHFEIDVWDRGTPVCAIVEFQIFRVVSRCREFGALKFYCGVVEEFGFGIQVSAAIHQGVVFRIVIEEVKVYIFAFPYD